MKGSRFNLSEEFTCNIKLLDDAEISCDFKKDTKGQYILDFVCAELDILEKDYFGLRYVDNNKQRHWLDVNKEVCKQLKDCKQPYLFFYRVKFYPTDPMRLGEKITRYQLYSQLKRDILHGRLLCSSHVMTELAAHIVQADVGDYDEREHGAGYITDLRLLPRQSEKVEEKVREVHKSLAGCGPEEAESRFLNLARSQDLYGVDPHPCKDDKDLSLYLGLTPHGIQVIREAQRVSGFSWEDVNKVSYDNRTFYVQTLMEKKKTNYAFRLADALSCKHLWKCCLEHMAFYSPEPVKTQNAKKSGFSPQNIFRRSKFKYSGKTENQLVSESSRVSRNEPPDFDRVKNLRVSMQKNNLNRMSVSNFDRDVLPGVVADGSSDGRGSFSSSGSASQLDRVDPLESLKQFETEHFPATSKSDSVFLDEEDRSSLARCSAEVDDCLETPIVPLQASHTLEAAPQILVEDPNGVVIADDAVNPSRSASSTGTAANPFTLLLLLAFVLVPLAVVAHWYLGIVLSFT